MVLNFTNIIFYNILFSNDSIAIREHVIILKNCNSLLLALFFFAVRSFGDVNIHKREGQ